MSFARIIVADVNRLTSEQSFRCGCSPLGFSAVFCPGCKLEKWLNEMRFIITNREGIRTQSWYEPTETRDVLSDITLIWSSMMTLKELRVQCAPTTLEITLAYRADSLPGWIRVGSVDAARDKITLWDWLHNPVQSKL